MGKFLNLYKYVFSTCKFQLNVFCVPEFTYAILYIMNEDSALYSRWAGFLNRWGLTKLALAVLDGAGPLTLILSQMLQMGAFGKNDDNLLIKLALTLENKDTCNLFADHLREDITK